MSDETSAGMEMSRISCIIPPRLGGRAADILVDLGAHTVLVENARAVRLRLRRGRGLLPGGGLREDNSPMEWFRTTVPRGSADTVMDALRRELELDTPGRGMVFAQETVEYSQLPPPTISAVETAPVGLRDLRLITCILSRNQGGERLVRTALRLGACVPVVTGGLGLGLRDQLGLLRITIPPEKDWVHLLVPAHDATGIQRLLIEEARMNRPGGGFLYQCPVTAGIPDTLLRLGRQEHAASMEQLIAAMDDLKHGTQWRTRFPDLQDASPGGGSLQRHFRELTLICAEGKAVDFVREAMRAGAGGATAARVRCLEGRDREEGMGARERCVMCVPAEIAGAVQSSLMEAAVRLEDPLWRLQICPVPAVFTHHGGGKPSSSSR